MAEADRGRSALWSGAGICAALFAFAFVAAPHSCEWGLTAYALAGGAAMLGMLALPLALRRDRALGWRIGVGIGCAVLALAVWFGGLLAANVRILCRQF
jgi:hypothetical protein